MKKLTQIGQFWKKAQELKYIECIWRRDARKDHVRLKFYVDNYSHACVPGSLGILFEHILFLAKEMFGEKLISVEKQDGRIIIVRVKK